MSQVAHQASAYLQFLWHEVARSISTPPWMGCQSIAGFKPPALNLLVPIYTPGWEWRVLPKNTTQYPWPGLKRGLLDQEVSTLTMRPTHLHWDYEQNKTRHLDNRYFKSLNLRLSIIYLADISNF